MPNWMYHQRPVLTEYMRGVRSGMLYGCISTVLALALFASITYALGLWDVCPASPAQPTQAPAVLLV